MARPGRTFLCRLAALSLAAAATFAGSTAEAQSGSAPVTVPDAIEMYPGSYNGIQPLSNDSDPEGDTLKMCQFGPEKYAGIKTDASKRNVDFQTKANAEPGVYTFTYYACDGTSSTPGTISLTVLKVPKVTVHKVPGQLGKLRVTSKAPFKIRFFYGSFQEDDPDGSLTIPKGGSVVFTVHRTKIDWVANTTDGDFLRSGHVSGIKLP